MVKADNSVLHALDLIEYAETAGKYGFLSLVIGDLSEGLKSEHIRPVAESWNIPQKLF